MPYLIEKQAYPGGPFQFLAQHGELAAHESYMRGIIGDWRTIKSLEVTPRLKKRPGYIVVIVRADSSRERYATTEN